MPRGCSAGGATGRSPAISGSTRTAGSALARNPGGADHGIAAKRRRQRSPTARELKPSRKVPFDEAGVGPRGDEVGVGGGAAQEAGVGTHGHICTRRVGELRTNGRLVRRDPSRFGMLLDLQKWCGQHHFRFRMAEIPDSFAAMRYLSPMNRFVLAAAIAGTLASPGLAQATAPNLGSQIHDALEGNGTEPPAIGALIRDAVNSLGGVCLNTQSYQVFRRAEDTVTLKLECADRPLYLLSIDGDGRMILSGGDGKVQAMEHEDGDIVQTGARAAPQAQAVAPRRPHRFGENDAIPSDVVPDAKPKPIKDDDDDDASTVDQTDPRGWTRWVFSGGLATFGLIAFLGYSQLAHHARFARGRERIGTYSSEEKDRMVAESAELRPDFYIHPSGLFIVRGKRGKRRLFPNRVYAYLYWRWGLKVAQIR